jgi:hypothetical protein
MVMAGLAAIHLWRQRFAVAPTRSATTPIRGSGAQRHADLRHLDEYQRRAALVPECAGRPHASTFSDCTSRSTTHFGSDYIAGGGGDDQIFGRPAMT